MSIIIRTLVVLSMAIAGSDAWGQPAPALDRTRSVTMTLAEYNRLSDLASRPASAVPGVPAVVATADLRVRVEPSGARGVFTLTGSVLQPGLQPVPLLSGATLVDVRTAAGPVPLVADGPVLLALVSGPSPLALTLDWGTSVQSQPGRASFVLPVPQAGAARAVIDLPGENVDVRLSSGLVTRRTPSGGRTVVEATLDPGAATTVSWSMRDSTPATPTSAARPVAEVTTLVTIGDADVRMAALVAVTVPRGTLRTLTLDLPEGYELIGVSGPTVEATTTREGTVELTLGSAPDNRHQCLVTLERALRPTDSAIDTGLVRVHDAQRERGHVAVQGSGAMELTAADRDGVERIDVREVAPALHAMARWPMLAAFRYQRAPGTDGPRLAFDVARFPEARVISAVAEYGTATTLVTAEGRALTEVRLQVQNRAQPYMRVALPPGDTIVSVEIAGQPAKPVSGADGTRVPLLRAGLAPQGSYEVSFVYVHAGTPFGRKGDLPMALPALDVPVGVMHWELFVPEQYAARVVGGNAIEAHIYEARWADRASFERVNRPSPVAGGRVRVSLAPDALTGHIRGTVRDGSSEVLPGVTVDLRVAGYAKAAVTAADGTFAFSGVPDGTVTVTASLQGFTSLTATLLFDRQARRVDFELPVSSLTETVTVTGASPVLSRGPEPPSQNVVNLQQRAAGVRIPVGCAESGKRRHEGHAPGVDALRGERLDLCGRIEDPQTVAQPLDNRPAHEDGTFEGKDGGATDLPADRGQQAVS